MTARKRKGCKPMIAKASRLPPLEDLMQLPELGKKLPGKPGPCALRLWVTKGRKSVSGEIIKMKCWMGTNGRVSTLDAYREFMEQLNDL